MCVVVEIIMGARSLCILSILRGSDERVEGGKDSQFPELIVTLVCMLIVVQGQRLGMRIGME